MRSRSITLVLAAVCLALVAPTSAVAKPSRPPSPTTVARDLLASQATDLRTVSLDGTTSRVATRLEEGAAQWSPSGDRIAGMVVDLGDRRWDHAIASTRPDGTDRQLVVTADELHAFNTSRGLPRADAYDYGPPFMGGGSWSPDGSRFVFAGQVRYPAHDPGLGEDDLYTYRLFSVAVDTSGRGVPGTLREVLVPTSAPVRDLWPAWSSTGWLVFVRASYVSDGGCWGDPVGQRELWAVRPGDPTTLRRVTDFSEIPHDHAGVTRVEWDPAGTRLVVGGNLDPQGDGHPGGMVRTGDLWLLDVTSGPTSIAVAAARVLRATTGTEWHGTWSPDGRTVAFMEHTAANARDVRSRLLLRDVLTGQERLLLEQTRTYVTTPDWNPAGRSPTW